MCVFNVACGNIWILSTTGIASCLITPSEFLSKPDMIGAVEKSLRENEFIVMMSLYFDSAPNRKIVLYSKDESKHGDMCSFLVEGKGHDLFQFKKEENTSVNGIYITIFRQENSKASRKQVAPFLLSYFEF